MFATRAGYDDAKAPGEEEEEGKERGDAIVNRTRIFGRQAGPRQAGTAGTQQPCLAINQSVPQRRGVDRLRWLLLWW
jgi:hypothetical protein